MPSRRSHQNSHHGCAQCKARRVKCDENRPACIRCHRQGRECTYTSLGPGMTWATPVAMSSPAHASQGQSSSVPLSPLPQMQPTASARDGPEPLGPPTPSSSSSATGIRISSLLSPASPGKQASHRVTDSNRQDLKLMHHWASRTVQVIPCPPDTEHIWRDFVTQQALEYDFLLHALFAVNAFHLAATETDDPQFYKDLGMEHHNLSLSLAQPALKDINTNNCHALFVFSCFTAIVSFSTPHLTTTRIHDPLKEVIEGFLLWRGISAVVESCLETVARGPMGTFFYLPDQQRPELAAGDMRHSMELLEQRIGTIDADSTAQKGYSGAIFQLYILFDRFTGHHEGFNAETAVFGWPILVPREYIDTLWKSEPMALAILAHYAVMLHRISHTWWAACWGVALVEAVEERLDEQWEPCLRWPKQEVHSKLGSLG